MTPHPRSVAEKQSRSPLTTPGRILLLLTAVATVGVAGHSPETGIPASRGFRLPHGDATLGKQAFVSHACHRCHTVEGVDLPVHQRDAAGLALHLGKEIHYVESYGDLLTSITNPEHLISEKYRAILAANGNADIRAAMPSFNRSMTVQQLIDIMTFLNSRYRSLAPDYSDAVYF